MAQYQIFIQGKFHDTIEANSTGEALAITSFMLSYDDLSPEKRNKLKQKNLYKNVKDNKIPKIDKTKNHDIKIVNIG